MVAQGQRPPHGVPGEDGDVFSEWMEELNPKGKAHRALLGPGGLETASLQWGLLSSWVCSPLGPQADRGSSGAGAPGMARTRSREQEAPAWSDWAWSRHQGEGALEWKALRRVLNGQDLKLRLWRKGRPQAKTEEEKHTDSGDSDG